MTNTLTLENGKYKVTYDEGKLFATRNGEMWRELTGDNLVYALMSECVDVQNQRNELLEALKNLMYYDNGKSEWEAARAAIAKATGVKS